jgi:ketosteroid isomerase-like protein
VRQGYEAFNTADIETLTRLFAENSSWHTPGRSSIAGDARGREAVFARWS